MPNKLAKELTNAPVFFIIVSIVLGFIIAQIWKRYTIHNELSSMKNNLILLKVSEQLMI